MPRKNVGTPKIRGKNGRDALANQTKSSLVALQKAAEPSKLSQIVSSKGVPKDVIQWPPATIWGTTGFFGAQALGPQGFSPVACSWHRKNCASCLSQSINAPQRGGKGHARGRGGAVVVSVHRFLSAAPHLQVRHCNQWSDYVGGRAGKLEEITLHLGESITQAYGKYGLHCIHKLVFITSQGRQFVFGRDHGYSFNAAPLCKDAVLHYVSGRAGRCIHALSFHWGSYTRRTCRPCVKDEAVRGTTGDH
ncbi:Zymogen granule membrane protein 16 [Varanus komodoensis]|nr:Zymogen granule membrane protein 16 [Varanus komodoensis]